MFLRIIVTVVFPIFTLIGVGALLDRAFRLDLPTLTALNFYVFVPVLAFVKMLDADLAPGLLVTVGLFVVVHALVMLAATWVAFSGGALAGLRRTASLCAMFFNAGNYGIPLTLMAFGSEQVGVIAVVMVTQNLLTFTLGIWLLERQRPGLLRALVQLVKVPTVDAILLALVLRAAALAPPAPLRQVLDYLGDGLIPVALLTLGVQLGRSRPGRDLGPLGAVTALRLAVSPLAAALLAMALRLGPPLSAVLVVSAGLPVAVNVYILAAQYREHEEFASQAVFWSTVLSALSIALLLALVGPCPPGADRGPQEAVANSFMPIALGRRAPPLRWARSLPTATMCYGADRPPPRSAGPTMVIRDLAESTCVRVSAQSGRLEACVERVYAGDRISDMLEQASDTTLVVTNLMGASLLRVAQLMDIPAVCLVNGKEPDPAMKEAAERQGTALLVSRFDMFETCGRLYAALRSGARPEDVRGTGG